MSTYTGLAIELTDTKELGTCSLKGSNHTGQSNNHVNMFYILLMYYIPKMGSIFCLCTIYPRWGSVCVGSTSGKDQMAVRKVSALYMYHLQATYICFHQLITY